MEEKNQIYWISMMGKILSNEADQYTQSEFADWLSHSEENRAEFDRFRKLWGHQIAQISQGDFDKDEVWKKISEQTIDRDQAQKQSHTSAKKRRIGFRRMSVAAAIFGLLMLSVTMYRILQSPTENMVKVAFDDSVEYPIILPDQSKVWLNEGSEIVYDASFENRKVTLSGEAFFDVAKNPEAPFEVFVGESHTKVLGTRFNLRENPTDATVDLFVEEGRVAFKIKDTYSSTKILTAGESAEAKIEEQSVVKTAPITTNTLSWKTNELTFDHTPMSSVLNDVSKYFNIEIKSKNDQPLNCTLKSAYSSPPLEEVLESIEFMLGAEIEKIGETYILDAPDCQTKNNDDED